MELISPSHNWSPLRQIWGLTVGSTRDIEYESDREEHVEMKISAPGFEALIMQPFDIVSAK
jgi:hypothetical protein